MKSNPFDAGIYDSCLTENCENQTQHKSGLCEKCRTFKCVACGKEYTAQNSLTSGVKPRCAWCKVKGKKGK